MEGGAPAKPQARSPARQAKARRGGTCQAAASRACPGHETPRQQRYWFGCLTRHTQLNTSSCSRFNLTHLDKHVIDVQASCLLPTAWHSLQQKTTLLTTPLSQLNHPTCSQLPVRGLEPLSAHEAISAQIDRFPKPLAAALCPGHLVFASAQGQ